MSSTFERNTKPPPPPQPVMDFENYMVDGICYCDCDPLETAQFQFLVNRGVLWLTEFECDGLVWGGNIIARNREAAELIAFGRGLNETVIA
jgi:hypothetical protein